jgi:hypothetical protein
MTRSIVVGSLALGLGLAPSVARAQGHNDNQQQGSTQQGSTQQNEATPSFDSLPQASKDTINKYLKGGSVDYVDKTEHKGKTVYQAHCTLGNKAKDKIILLVDDAGKLIGSTPDKHHEKK